MNRRLGFASSKFKVASSKLRARALSFNFELATSNLQLIRSSLCFFESGVFLDELLLAEAGEADEEFGRVADAFAAKYQTAAVLGMTDVRAGREASARRR